MTDTPPQYWRAFERVKNAAQRETAAILKALPKEYRERVKGIAIRFEDKPSKAMIEKGSDSEALSLANFDSKEVALFLMTFYERYGAEPGAILREFRKVLLQELGDMTGMEKDLAETP